jgi:hypothetical protein
MSIRTFSQYKNHDDLQGVVKIVVTPLAKQGEMRGMEK